LFRGFAAGRPALVQGVFDDLAHHRGQFDIAQGVLRHPAALEGRTLRQRRGINFDL
jgi:hypothetical protein